MTASADAIIALVTHARDVPAGERQAFGRRTREIFGRDGLDGLLLETCHRLECYTVVPDAAAAGRIAEMLPVGGRALRGEAAVRHAIAVATGRDSVVIGEDQVLHQLRAALDAARAEGAMDGTLERLLAAALRAGRRARSWRQGPARSLADVALDTLQREAGVLAGRDILVVGAGSIGRLAAAAGARAGARITVTSRSADHAADLALSTGARVEAFDPGSRIGRFVGVVVGLAGPWPLGPDAIGALARRSIPIVDLSVPLAVPDRLRTRAGARITTADDLARSGPAVETLPHRSLARLDALIDRTAREYVVWLDARERRAAAQALVERADREREAALAALWRRLPDLDPQARATIEGMSRHLAERLLREPLERLAADADGRHERAVRELWAL